MKYQPIGNNRIRQVPERKKPDTWDYCPNDYDFDDRSYNSAMEAYNNYISNLPTYTEDPKLTEYLKEHGEVEAEMVVIKYSISRISPKTTCFEWVEVNEAVYNEWASDKKRVAYLKEKEVDLRNDESLYLYYQIDIDNNPDGWNFCIAESLDEVLGILKSLDVYLDDPDKGLSITIRGIGMTPVAYREYLKDSKR